MLSGNIIIYEECWYILKTQNNQKKEWVDQN